MNDEISLSDSVDVNRGLYRSTIFLRFTINRHVLLESNGGDILRLGIGLPAKSCAAPAHKLTALTLREAIIGICIPKPVASKPPASVSVPATTVPPKINLY